ncbi:MAG: Ig-like domain-containing protein [Gemmatimonadaceae bacterium]|nr:Ig-like domain-containing protein [Gemmatimonadaceae bacterium]
MSRIARLFTLFALAACGGGGGSDGGPTNPPPTPGPVAVASVTVTSPQATLIPPQTVQLSVALRDASSNEVTGRAIVWTASAPQVATVSASGVVTAVASGDVTITASSEGKSGTVSITVLGNNAVGTAGGTLTFAGGTVQLVVPPGAVSNNTAITVTAQAQPSTPPPNAVQFVGPVYEVGPAGTTFSQPVVVKIKYGANELPAWVMSGDLSLLQTNGTQWTGLTDIALDASTRTISGRTTSFAGVAGALRVAGSVAGQLAGGTTTVGIGAQAPQLTLTPGSGSVNEQQRSVRFFAGLAPRGTSVPLPANTPALLYRWSTTGRNGAISSGAGNGQWGIITDAQYTATNSVLNQLHGTIDTVRVDVLLNPASVNNPAAQSFVSAIAVVDADLQVTYEITPALPKIGPGATSNLRLLIRDRQGQVQAIAPGREVSWKSSAVFGVLGAAGPQQLDVVYTAFSQFTAPPPRVDDVVATVTEKKRSIIRTAIPGPFGFEGFKEDTVDRTLTHGEAKTFVEVKVPYQVVVTPNAPTLAAGGSVDLTVTLNPQYTGPGLGYKYTNPGVHGTLDVPLGVVTNRPQVKYTANHNGAGTEVIQVEVWSVVAGVPLESIGVGLASIKTDSVKLGWRITQFTRTAISGIAQTDCTDYCDVFTRLEANPGKGFVFAFPNQVATPLSATQPTPGAYLLVDVIGNGSTVKDYSPTGALMWTLAHRYNQAYLTYRPASGTFTYTGTPIDGGFTGQAKPLLQFSFYDFRVSITAVKNGDELTGEIEVAEFPFATPSTNWVTKRWQFRATRLP